MLIHALTQLCGICYKFNKKPSRETGEEIIKIIDNCDEKLLKVKEEIVKIVADWEETKDKEVSVIETESGYLIEE